MSFNPFWHAEEYRRLVPSQDWIFAYRPPRVGFSGGKLKLSDYFRKNPAAPVRQNPQIGRTNKCVPMLKAGV